MLRADLYQEWSGDLHRMSVRFVAGVLTLIGFFALLFIEQSQIVRDRIALEPALMSESGGYAVSYPLGEPWRFGVLRSFGDSNGSPFRSATRIFVDGVEQSEPHSRHVDISELGQGRFSHWGGTLLLSSPDQGNPMRDGRVYEAELAYAAPVPFKISLLFIAGFLFGTGRSSRSRSHISNGRIDVGWIVLFWLIAAFLTYLGFRAGGIPAIVESTDAGNIASWVAGNRHPERFATDILLSDPNNTKFYISIFMSAVEKISKLTGNIGTAYEWLYLPLIGFVLTGFYLLGKALTGDRIFSALWAVMTVVPISIWGLNEIFGIYYVPLPRNAYDAGLPFFMLAFWRLGGSAKHLPALFALYGLSIYIHPVSAPAGAAGLWLASLAVKSDEERFAKRFLFMVLAGLVFVGMAIPFATMFLSSFSGGEHVGVSQASNDQLAAIEAFKQTNGPMFYDAWLAFGMLLEGTGRAVWPVWVIGAFGLTIVPILNPERRRAAMFLGLFLVGVLVASVGLSAIDQAISARLGRTPMQVDLIRGLRLVVVPMLGGFILALAELHRFASAKSAYATPALAGCLALVIAGYWGAKFPNRLADAIGLSSLRFETRSPDVGANQMMATLRERPVDGTIIPIGRETVGLAVRYAGLQPIAFIRNDANAFFYSGSPDRFVWTDLYALRRGMDENSENGILALDALIAETGATYLLIEKSVLPPLVEAAAHTRGDVVEAFGKWTLVDLIDATR